MGGRIRAARQVAGLTQAGLAEAVGVSRSAVAQWETDRAGQVGVNLARVAAVLRVSSEHLLIGRFPNDGGAAAEDATELALLRLYRGCAGEDRQILLRMAQRFARQAERLVAASIGASGARPAATVPSASAQRTEQAIAQLAGTEAPSLPAAPAPRTDSPSGGI